MPDSPIVYAFPSPYNQVAAEESCLHSIHLWLLVACYPPNSYSPRSLHEKNRVYLVGSNNNHV